MSSPSNSQNQPPNSPPQDPNITQQIQNPPQSDDNNTQSPKTLTLDIPEENRNPQYDNDPNQSDPDDLTTISTAATIPRRVGGGYGKRKKKRGAGPQGKRSQKKLETLIKNLNPVPFIPFKNLDFNSHESLLRKLGLWEFVHLQFDVTYLRVDLLAQLIAHFNPQSRCSYVNNARIKVSRPDLARALCLPVKKDKADNVVEEKESKESIEFMEEFVSTWLLLHEDTWLMSDDILNVNKLIKDGNFEKVDWSKLIWLMVEKELAAAPDLGNCYYASHLQLLLKSQKVELFKEEDVAKMDIDIKEDDEEEVEEDVKTTIEEIRGVSELDEHNIELSLGGLDNAVKDDGDDNEEDEKVRKDEAVGDEERMDFEGCKEDEEQGRWRKMGMDRGFLQRCNLGEVGGVECELERKQEEGEGVEGRKEGEDGEEEEEEVDFNILPKGDGLDGINSENLIAVMEASQITFSAGMQIRDNLSSGDFLASRVDAQSIPGSSSLFNNVNSNKRDIEHLENDMPHHAFNGANKRMRSDGHWDMKSPSEHHMYIQQVEHILGKSKMCYEAKEQECNDLSINQQMLMNELQQREDMIHNLHKAKMEEQTKRQAEIYRLERELYMMGSLLEGYRKALKETHKAFAAYRAKCPLPEEPIYKDTGSGGLVLSTIELEKLRLKQEEEERQKRLFNEKKIKEFEAGWVIKFEAYKNGVELLCDKLTEFEKKVNLLKEDVGKRKVLEKSECAPAKEPITHESV